MISKYKLFFTKFYTLHLFLHLCFCKLVNTKNIDIISTAELKEFYELQEIWKTGIEEHNRYRKIHNASPLQGDLQLHKNAQQHADYLAKTNKVELSPYTQYGENVATSYEATNLDAVRDVVKRWYNRILYFNFENPEENQNLPLSGPFCSVVWKSTNFIGVGVARNNYEAKWIIVVLYDPGATDINFKENVSPPKYNYENLFDLFVNFLVNRHLLRQYV